MHKDKNSRDNMILIIFGILMIIGSLPLFIVLQTRLCDRCHEVGCGLCGMGSLLIAALVFILGLVMASVNYFLFRKNKQKLNMGQQQKLHQPANDKKQYPVFMTLRWFFAIVFMIAGVICILIPQGLDIQGILFVLSSLLLIFWDKIFRQK